MTVNRPVWTLKSSATSTFERRAVGVLVGDGGLVLRQPGGDGDVDRAEAERAELEGGPVEVRIELLGDGDVLGGGAAVVLEVDGVGQGARRLDEALRAVAGGADHGVGVVGRPFSPLNHLLCRRTAGYLPLRSGCGTMRPVPPALLRPWGAFLAIASAGFRNWPLSVKLYCRRAARSD